MSFKNLLEPVIESGIKNVNFFEGRLLSGKDLTDQEAANRIHRRHLGRTLGHGVVEGLQVSVENTGANGQQPVVRVGRGLAINLEGETLELALDYVDIRLSRTFDPPVGIQTGFKNCSPLPSETLVPSGAGLYILVMSPAHAWQEFAPQSGLQKKGIAHNCGRRYLVESVQFRLVKFDPTLMPDIADDVRNELENQYLSASNPVGSNDLPALSKMRNLVAQVCFGTDATTRSARDPNFVTKNTTTAGIDALLGMEEGLSLSDTPLALLYWNLEGIVFVDNWAVKRKASHRDSSPYNIPTFTRHSYSRADESRLQFQEHLTFLMQRIADLSTVKAVNYFRFLPPVGYLPIRTTSGTSNIGFNEQVFFADAVVRNSVFVEAAELVPISQSALALPPVDLLSEEFMWLYRTRENAQEADNNPTVTLQEYLVFTSGHAPYFGNARFNRNKWDYSNYGLI
ncbi:MAG: hypothetical protein NVV73_00915 [Cellvibrionaceae bacterium]|nr:hypothetical protein [Cellvibrionaceae bacterium]